MNIQMNLQLAGAVQLVVAGANFFLPAKLQYRENLAKVSPIVRQIFTVHSAYIVLVLIGFALVCLLFPEDLGGASALGRFLCASFAVFWGSRVFVQFFYYDLQTKRDNPLGTLLFGVIFLYLAATFAVTTFFPK
jgi:hypothetical protein